MDVTISAVANADVANVMARGDVDAALVPEPWGATLLQQGAKMVLDYDEIYLKGQYDVAVVVVRKEFMENNPDMVEKFLRELFKEKDLGTKQFRIDIGAKDREDALSYVSIGDPIVLDTTIRKLANDKFTARALDDRLWHRLLQSQ